MKSEVTLYGHYDSPYVARVIWMLEECGFKYSFKEVDLAKGEQRSDSFLKLNPCGTVPLLQIDGENLWDSVAILRYLSSRKKFLYYDVNPLKQAKIDGALAFASDSIGEPISKLCWQRYWKEKLGAGPIDEPYCKRLENELSYNLPLLEQLIGSSGYLCGEFSIADISAYPLIALFERSRVSLEDYPKVLTWIEKIKKRPSLEKVLYSVDL